MNLSFWEFESFFKDVDVIIVGSGIVGLSGAIYIKENRPKLKVVVLERGALPSGASTRNAGFACFGSVTELMDDLSIIPENEMVDLVELRWKGLQKLRKRVGDAGMDYQSYGAYEIFKEGNTFQDCKDKLAYLNRMLQPITQVSNTFELANGKAKKFGFQGIEHLIVNTCEGQLHTGKMMASLLQIAREKDVQVFNGLGVEHLEDQGDRVGVHLENGWELNAAKVLVATNGFTKKLFPHLTLNPARNQVLITKPIANLPFKGCFHYDKGYVYFRNIGNRVLLGGGRNLAFDKETTTEFGFTDLIKNYLLGLLHKYFLPEQNIEIERWWSGIMGVGPTKKTNSRKGIRKCCAFGTVRWHGCCHRFNYW